MKSTKITNGTASDASQLNNLIDDAKGGSFLLVHAQASPGLTLKVEPGVVYVGATRVIYAGGNTPSFSAPSANPRIDLVTIDNAGTIAIVQGTENASPSAPAYPANKLVLAEVYNRVSETQIYDTDQGAGNGYVSNDVRPFLGGSYIASDAQVDAAAAISFSKLNSGAINAALIPDADGTRDLGSGSKEWNNIYAKTAVYIGGVAISAPAMFGDGSDGSVTFDGSTTILGMAPSSSIYTMTRDIYCINITINTGVTLKTAGFRIFATGTLSVTGTIDCSGGDGTNGSNGPGGTNTPGDSGGAAGNGGAAAYTGTTTLPSVLAGNNGGAGAGISSYAAQSAGGGTNGTAVTKSIGKAGVAGASGGGGGNAGTFGGSGSASGGGGASGGSAGAQSSTPLNAPRTAWGAYYLYDFQAGSVQLYTVSGSSGGAGGGGAGGSNGSSAGAHGGCGGGGGGSGAPGGIIVIYASIIIVNSGGKIQANGGKGGNGGAGGSGNTGFSGYNGGGGGGGGAGSGGSGGVIILVYVSYTNAGSVTTNGGAAGTVGGAGAGGNNGSNPGTAGAAGSAGNAGTTGSIIQIYL